MKRGYKHLSLMEREEISILKVQGKSMREIGRVLGRHPSTIIREFARNVPPVHRGYYRGHKAHERAMKRITQAHQRPRALTFVPMSKKSSLLGGLLNR